MSTQNKTIIDATMNIGCAAETIRQVLEEMPEECNWTIRESDAVTILTTVIGTLNKTANSLEPLFSYDQEADKPNETVTSFERIDTLENTVHSLRGFGMLVSSLGAYLLSVGEPSDDRVLDSAFDIIEKGIKEACDAIKGVINS